jgi:phospholipid transport system substrate-binding protein
MENAARATETRLTRHRRPPNNAKLLLPLRLHCSFPARGSTSWLDFFSLVYRGYLQTAIAALFLIAVDALAAEPAPDALVRDTIEQVTAVIGRDADIQAGDRAKIYALVESKVLPCFDFTRMTRLAIGKNWRTATPEQREAIVTEFRTLLVRTYAVSLSLYRGEKIAVEPVQLVAGADDVMVKTRIQQSAGAPARIEYAMYATERGWKVYDVIVEGVSLVTNYRSTFENQIRQHGIDGLVKLLAERNRAADKKS